MILHVRYTARQGVDPTKVKIALDSLFNPATTPANLAIVFNLRSDFPTEWAAFAGGTGNFAAVIRKDYFPYMAQSRTITITEMELYAEDTSVHHSTGSPSTATTGLASSAREFTYSAAPDAAGPTQVLTRTTTNPVYLLVRYALS